MNNWVKVEKMARGTQSPASGARPRISLLVSKAKGQRNRGSVTLSRELMRESRLQHGDKLTMELTSDLSAIRLSRVNTDDGFTLTGKGKKSERSTGRGGAFNFTIVPGSRLAIVPTGARFVAFDVEIDGATITAKLQRKIDDNESRSEPASMRPRPISGDLYSPDLHA